MLYPNIYYRAKNKSSSFELLFYASNIPRIRIPMNTSPTDMYCSFGNFSLRKIRASTTEHTQYEAMSGAAIIALPDRA